MGIYGLLRIQYKASTNWKDSVKQVKIIIEKHRDVYVVYPVGVKGVVVGEGDTCEEALKDVQSALQFHVETFGAGMLDGQGGLIV